MSRTNGPCTSPLVPRFLKLILEGPLRRKLKIFSDFMKYSRWGFSRVLISPMALIFAAVIISGSKVGCGGRLYVGVSHRDPRCLCLRLKNEIFLFIFSQ